ncbi:hypothetical protein NAV33_07450 [Pseudomonas stutzeri]|uniref:hypothetical protein n=1 Tax=Stutzerimonas stutzeri TaxID=316 RepID=UPI002109712A|nr:hypothetical protein [Stutzerimonas stutzeri]MCQ4311730.1 hypothetical protein [Stutzerimonas stutzeri]
MKLLPIPQHDGVERPRGAVDDREVVFGSYSGTGSRRFNPVEYAAQTVALEEELEAAIEAAREATAAKFLAFYRELLKPYRISTHRVVVCAGMGMSTIDVTNLRTGKTEGVEFLPSHWDRGVYALLREISQALNWDWAAYLDGEVIAGPADSFEVTQ